MSSSGFCDDDLYQREAAFRRGTGLSVLLPLGCGKGLRNGIHPVRPGRALDLTCGPTP
jgi:hypothetical protein